MGSDRIWRDGGGVWHLGDAEEGDLLYIASEASRRGVVYHFEHRGAEVEGFPNHEHSFEAVLEEIFFSPEDFYVPERFSGDYSAQERALMDAFRSFLVGGSDV